MGNPREGEELRTREKQTKTIITASQMGTPSSPYFGGVVGAKKQVKKKFIISQF